MSPKHLRIARALGAGGAYVILVQRIDQGAAQHAREDRRLWHCERRRRQRQRAHRRPESRPPSREAPCGRDVQPDRKHHHQQHAEPEVRHCEPQLRERRQCRIARAAAPGRRGEPHGERNGGRENQRGGARARKLGRDVSDGVARREMPRERERDGDGRVDVTARDGADGVGGHEEAETEGEGDTEDADRAHRPREVPGGEDRSTGTTHHQDHGADRLGDSDAHALVHRGLLLLWRSTPHCSARSTPDRWPTG